MKKAFVLFLIFYMPFCIFAKEGVIRSLNGTVELKQSGSSSYVQAKIGDTVSENTEIYAGLRSNAVIDLGSTTVNVSSLTRLTLKELLSSSQEEKIDMNLRTGRVRIDVNPPAGIRTSVNVTSPSATASVRGTTFEFDTRTVRVEHGSVAFGGNKGYSVLVKAGSVSTVSFGAGVPSPVSVLVPQVSMPVGADPANLDSGKTETPVRPGTRQGTFTAGVTYPD
ncbi:MAG: FecR family protein [Treponema sp.]|nr:FecR family protein [Treponema sp.]